MGITRMNYGMKIRNSWDTETISQVITFIYKTKEWFTMLHQPLCHLFTRSIHTPVEIMVCTPIKHSTMI